MIPLFAYGTLRDPEYQRALFDRTYPTRPASLDGWRVVVAERGYLTVIADPHATARGDLVELDARGLALADRWEDVPVYVRVRARARHADAVDVACWLYVRPTASLTAPPRGALAMHDRATVLAAIRALRKTSCPGDTR